MKVQFLQKVKSKIPIVKRIIFVKGNSLRITPNTINAVVEENKPPNKDDLALFKKTT